MIEQDYKKIALSRLTDRHRSDEAFLAILDTLIEIKAQRQKQYITLAGNFLDIDKSTGKNLDVIGKLIGEERTLVNFIDRAYFGFIGARLAESYDIGYWYSLYKNKYGTLRTLTDEEYRRVLKARVVKNSSNNGRNSFLEVINILANNESSVVIEGTNNTAIEVRVADEDGLVSYYLSKYKNDNNLIPVPLGRRLGVVQQQSIPVITCSGATNTALMHRAMLIDQNESTVFPEAEKFIVNGEEVAQPPAYLEITPTSLPSFPPPNGYYWEGSVEIKNNSDQDVRFEHQFTPDDQNQIRVVLSGNPTVISFNENQSGVCLSAKSGESISCVGATSTSGCIDLEGVWDLEVNGQIILSNASPEDIQTYLESGTGIVEEGEVCCDMGYYRPVSLTDLAYEIFNGDTVYIPISLTPNGQSITTPITIDATPPDGGEIDWYAIGMNLSEQLGEQLRPHGLDSVWDNNFKEFGIPYHLAEQESNNVLEFYVLNEGNSFSPTLLRRGLPPIVCVSPS